MAKTNKESNLSMSIYSLSHYPWKNSLYVKLSDIVSLNTLYFYGSGAHKVYTKWSFMRNIPNNLINRFARIFRFYIAHADVFVCLDSIDSTSIFLFLLYKMKRSKSINIVAENRVIYAKSDLLKGYMSRLKKAISYSMLRRYDLLIAESEASREFLVDIGCPTDKIKLILHGVDLSIFQPSIVQSKTEDRRLKVLYAGGFIESKGYRYLSEALDSGRLSAFDFTIISFGSVIESKRFDHKRNVKLIPTLSYYEMVMLYQSVDIVLVPSIVTEFDAERSPNVVIEAMACGRTVIATNIGGIPSYLGDAGILIPSCNSEAIVEALLRLEKNPSLVDYYGSRAAKRAVDLFDITKYAEALYLMSAKMVGKETALVCN